MAFVDMGILLMIRAVDITDSFEYDGFFCYELYVNYLSGIVDVQDVLRYVRRWVIEYIRTRYLKKLGIEVCEDLVQSVMLEVWVAVSEQSLPSYQVETFHKFLKTLTFRKVSKVFPTLYDDALKEIEPALFNPGYNRRFSGADDVEDKLFLDDLPKCVRDRLLQDFRFSEENIRKAAVYIIERLFSQKRIVHPWLKNRFQVKNVRFLIQHVKIRMRHHLYEIREEFPSLRHNHLEDLLEEVRKDFYE